MEQGDRPIYWTQLCGNRSTRDAFWDTNYTWTTDSPDLTQCFQDSVLVWLPCGYLLVAALLYLPYLLNTPSCRKIRDISLLCAAKTVLCCFLTLESIINVVMVYQIHDAPVVAVLAPTLLGISFVLSAVIVLVEFSRAVPSSGVLIVFWLLQLVFGIVPFRSYIMHSSLEKVWLVIFYIKYTVYAILFILHCFNDMKSGLKSGEKTCLIAKDHQDDTQVKLKPCPEKNANFISRLFFLWITRLLIDGYRRPLVFGDLWDLMPEDLCTTVVPRFRDHWEKHVKETGWQMIKKKSNPAAISISSDSSYYGSADGPESRYEKYPLLPLPPKPSSTEGSPLAPVNEYKKKQPLPYIWKPLIVVFGGYYMMGGFYKFCYDIISFISPRLLNLLITFVAEGDPYVWHGYLYVTLMFCTSVCQSILTQQYFLICYKVGMRIRTAIVAILYRKALVINSTAKRSSTVGEIVNLMAVDAQRIADAMIHLHNLWSAPLTIAVAMYFLWQELGVASLAGLVLMNLLILLNAWLGRMTRSLQIMQMKQKDNRIKLINEVLNGIKVLKLHAWENSFQEHLKQIREQELQRLRKIALLDAFTNAMWFLAPYLVGLVSFAAFIFISPDNVLDANKAFVSLSLFNLMNLPFALLPMTISFSIQAIVSINRISKFVRNEELDPDNVSQDPQVRDLIKISEASFSWGDNNGAILKDINLSIPEGKLVAIVGSVGSGKSSLLSAMLGEMEVMAGNVHLRGSVAYVPQQAWIQNATVKDNILFGQSYEQRKYKKVISACALPPDLQILPGGDMTEIGEKGINLSGGQKQRVSLGRALYQDPRIYLLDDPLSAVDSHVGKHIFDNVIGPKGALKGKTRVLVTNSLKYLPEVDTIVVLKDGKISEMGSFHNLLQNNGAFAEFILQYLNNHGREEEDEESRKFHDGLREQLSDTSGTGTSSASEVEVDTNGQPPKFKKWSRKKKMPKSDLTNVQLEEGSRTMQQLTEKEVAQTGSVKSSVFITYLKYCGLLNMSLTLGSYMVYLAAMFYSSIWLADWSNDPQGINSTQDLALRDLRLVVYGAMGGIQTLSILVQSFALAFGMVHASRMVHSNMLKAVLRAPMSFFDTTPLGRILNRFSKDMDIIDFYLPTTSRVWLVTFSKIITTIFIIIYSTPLFLIVIIPLGIFYSLVQRFYIATSCQLKRLDSVRKSPIFSHFSETVTGTFSIRAYQVSDRFVELSDRLIDESNMTWYPNVISDRWLGFYLETVGNFIVLFAGLFAVIQRGSIDAGIAGLSVSYALQITSNIYLFVAKTCGFQNHIVAIERIQEYTECPQEAPAIIEDNRPDTHWPQEGQVTFQQYSTQYRPGLDLVLKGINCTFKPGERVGIVGRTGAGKSSLTLALFRIIEATSGSIIIDGQKISNIGLNDLRSKLTIIPQEPVLFSGTLRMNLDPFETKTDEELWLSLELVDLKTFVESLPEKLEHQCSENGENISVGQRQLVCLARALLHKTRILVLDEATAAVDLETDNLIQSTIRGEFQDCTVITIAHRLYTIMDYDRIVVLDNGNITEFASPTELLRNKNGIFYGMVKEAGLL